MKKNLFKALPVYLWGLCFFALLSGIAILAGKSLVSAADIPSIDVTYNSDNDWEGTLVLNENQTVKISGVEHDNNGTDYGSVIKICDGATVNLVFEGNSVLVGNNEFIEVQVGNTKKTIPKVISAGIEVEYGATVNIYGLEGSSLTVTGGSYGAGIGGIGYVDDEHESIATHPPCGNINIYSGNIVATGGTSGSGIGSGRNAGASNISIYGGTITSTGNGGGAGIGGVMGGDYAFGTFGINIYDGNITATGSGEAAGIGGVGYGSPDGSNLPCGNINIYKGNIKSTGGGKGAGIGSGNHSSASDINIYGGNITSLGGGAGGSGIGSGYGTSGGADKPAKKVGFYNGGNITISGGTIRAASYKMNFDNFDPYNTESLYSEGYSDSFAAGIGGGYGASSGNIVIEGNADVIALGSCGGAGIGSGRGTSKEEKYEKDSFNVNITIRGDSKVIAMATDDRRPTVKGDDGGAAIGLGRGCTIDGEPKGTVKIEGNAVVFAVAPDHAQAIGASCCVGEFDKPAGSGSRPADAHLASISFGSGTIVMAVSDGYRDAIDHVNESDIANFVLVNFSDGEDGYFENRSDFFTEDKFPLKVEAVDANNTKSKTMFAIQKPKKLCMMVRILEAERYNFIMKDYHGEEGEKIFISNEKEENSAQFYPNPSEVKRYDAFGLTARLDRDGAMDSKYGELKLKIKAKEGIFEYGSTFFCDRITDQAVIDELNSELDKEYADKLERILYFDIGVKDRNGDNYDSIKGGKVRVYVEIPDGWDKDEVLALFVRSLDDESFADTQKLETIDGVTYLSFEINHFSDYALFDPIKRNEDNPEEESEKKNNGEVDFLPTGDNIYFLSTVLSILLLVSLVIFLMLHKQRGKRFRK